MGRHPPNGTGADMPYKSLGSVFNPKESPPGGGTSSRTLKESPNGREQKKKLACNTSMNPPPPAVNSSINASLNGGSRSIQSMTAERSMSVSQQDRYVAGMRTPHRSVGYGGGGQPSRGPNRFGPVDMRASLNERLSSSRHNQRTNLRTLPAEMYKSNSSLDLDHDIDMMEINGKREFGSHGSLEVMGRHHPAHLPSSAMLPGGPVITGAASHLQIHGHHHMHGHDGPAAVSTLTRPTNFNSGIMNRSEESGGSLEAASASEVDGSTSPKHKKKGSVGFWNKDKSARKSQKSIFNKKKKDGPESQKSVDSSVENLDNKLEDKHRRRFFSHHDIGSVCATLSMSARLKTLQRRNTTTGASAASAALRNSGGGGESPEGEELDQGDGINNELVLSCPYFRNEIGGEAETQIALTRETGRTWGIADDGSESKGPCHIPRLARGFNLLETTTTHWQHGICPYGSSYQNLPIERTDMGSNYYNNYFYGKDHQDWFGMDENLGPIAISIRRERVPSPSDDKGILNSLSSEQFMYRLIMRTSELLPLRGTVLEDSIPALKAEKVKGIPTKEVLEFCFPELQLSSLHLGVQTGPCEEQLVKLDKLYNDQTYKVGVMYCKAGQQTEEDMYNNEEGGPAFNEFLDLIGQRVRLKGFHKYKAGLCNKNDSTGMYSVYTEHEGREIMFHVSTLLPYTPNNRQQLPRKRYIGNDIVTLVFQEPGALPFIPNIRSQFQHVFIIVRVHNPCSENTHYSLAVTRSKNVPIFGPPIPKGAMFPKSQAFTKFLLSKLINAENAVHRSDKFVSMATRTRQEYLKDLATNFVTQTTLDSGNKFALFASKKKISVRPRFSPDASLRGALSWAIVVEDCSTNQQLEAFIAISSDTLVIIRDNMHRDILFIAACKSILGWSATHNSIRIFYHQGECVIVHSKDWEADDMAEISARLKSVTPGAASQEFSLRRNQLGQLGFHVQHDGLITEVENFGYAWQTGLRQGSRLVEICKHPVTTLTHQQMVDLLKTSLTVTVTVIPPHPDGSPRQGCDTPSCNYTLGGGYDGDYENVNSDGEKGAGLKPGIKQAPANGKTRYERSLSPPSSSSGYGTGSSSKSYTETTGKTEGTLTSSSSGHSSDERWYDFMDQPPSTTHTPPPIPSRIVGGVNVGTNKTSAFASMNGGSSSSSTGPVSSTSSQESTPGNQSINHHHNNNNPPSSVTNSHHQRTSPEFPGYRQTNGYQPASTVTVGNYGPPSAVINTQQPPVRGGYANNSHAAGYESGSSSSDTVKSSSSTVLIQDNSSPNTTLSNNTNDRINSSSSLSNLGEESTRFGEAKSTYLTDFEYNSSSKTLSSDTNGQLSSSHSRNSINESSVGNSLSNSVHPPTESNMLRHERLAALKSSPQSSEGSDHQGSDRMLNIPSQRSEDELSSSSQSPHRTRNGIRRNTNGGGATTPSSTASNSSRGHSPRTVNGLPAENNPNSTAAKKKVARSARNSANLTSTLQEDLMKLISPDYNPEDPNTHVNGHHGQQNGGVKESPLSKLPKKTLSELSLMKSRSRENIARLEDNVSGEVHCAFHMARPVTVISSSSLTSPGSGGQADGNSRLNISTASSNPETSTSNNNVNKNTTRTSPISATNGGPKRPIADVEWTSLVDTATKAMLSSSPEEDPSPLVAPPPSHTSLASQEEGGVKSEGLDYRHLLERVHGLEEQLVSERAGKEQLSGQVEQLQRQLEHLRGENVRLQEESHTAAQQLRRFTEWFFQTIDKS